MTVPLLAAIAALLGLLFLASRVVARHPGFLGETFFRDRSGGGWPSGVQEDDDFAWRWRPGQRRIDPPGPRLAPAVPNPDESPPPVAVQRISSRVRRR